MNLHQPAFVSLDPLMWTTCESLVGRLQTQRRSLVATTGPSSIESHVPAPLGVTPAVAFQISFADDRHVFIFAGCVQYQSKWGILGASPATSVPLYATPTFDTRDNQQDRALQPVWLLPAGMIDFDVDLLLFFRSSHCEADAFWVQRFGLCNCSWFRPLRYSTSTIAL